MPGTSNALLDFSSIARASNFTGFGWLSALLGAPFQELAGSLDSIADECLIMGAELQLPEARQCVSLLADISGLIRRWLMHDDGYDDAVEHLRRLNPLFIVFAPKIAAGFTTRLKSEQANIRKLVIRMDTMRRTSYVAAGYLIAESPDW